MTAVLHAEWIKLRSLRSTYLTMLCAIALGTGLGFLDTTSVAHHWAAMSAQDRAAFDPVGDSFTGLVFAQLAFGVLGVLAISTGYGTGMIRTTLAATPRRGTLFTAKALVVGAVALVLGEAFAFGTFLLGQAMLAAGHLDVSWSYLPDKLVLSNAADVLGQVHALAVKPRLPSLGLAYLDLLLYLVVALGLGAWRAGRDA